MNLLTIINLDIDARIINGGRDPPKSKFKKSLFFIKYFFIRNGIRSVVFL